ncbi:NlpC/P60 family protein [Rhodococcus wratislaviensis IFP 2016]|nr:NlpC/P60 family protein [Rhodococcus wratislaviensis IFP 2016]
MSVDPSAIIVAVATALGGAIHGSEAPPALKDYGTQQVQQITDAAPAIGQQVNDAVEQLPPEAQGAAQQAITDTANAVQEAIETYAPPPESASPPPDTTGEIPVTEPGPDGTIPEYVDTVERFDSTPVAVPEISHLPTVSDASTRAASQLGAIAVFVPWFQKAGSICDGIKAPVLAALYSTENNFRYGTSAPVSPDGARGPGQFMPGTWAKYGRDADGDGKADVLAVGDSVMASGHLLCDMYEEIDSWKQAGIVSGDVLDLTLAGYNAGVGAVRRSGGMPSGLPDYENQTKPYVAKIRAAESRFASFFASGAGDWGGGGGVGGRIVESALRYLGLPYVWGGGNVNGPSGGGFDCSGLTSYAVHAATTENVSLPRTSETQWNVGTEIPLADARPGDLLFGNWGPAGPGHVAIYIGNGKMVHAPTTGDVVRIAPVFDGMKARRVV